MDKQSSYLQTIHAAFPELEIQSAELSKTGQFNDLLIVNGDLLFRFPGYPEALQTLRQSTEILRWIRGRVSMPVPDPIFASLDTLEVGKAFVGYRMIPGDPVDIYALENRYDSETCQRLADQLAAFLKSLHSIPVADWLPAEDSRPYWTDLYVRIQEKLFPLLSSAAQTEIREHFEPYLAEPPNFNFSRALVHGDFGVGNILFDSSRLEFTGVIDFDFAHFGDPALDFASVFGFRGRGATFARRFFSVYPDLESLMPRVLFYTGTYLLQEALFGVENNEPDLIASGLDPYL
jgi:aminoglycoside 2''-phosphotransferase